MRLFGFGFIASMGAAGLAGIMFPEFRTDIFFGWLGPAAAGTGSTLFFLVLHALEAIIIKDLAN